MKITIVKNAPKHKSVTCATSNCWFCWERLNIATDKYTRYVVKEFRNRFDMKVMRLVPMGDGSFGRIKA